MNIYQILLEHQTIFADNKYTKIYAQIIENRISFPLPKNLYSERHHWLPKFAFGDNDSIVRLSAREHYICHWLLTKMVLVPDIKMRALYAHGMMSRKSMNQKRCYTSWQYDRARKSKSAATKLRDQLYPERNVFRKKGKENVNFGKKHTDSTKRKMSARASGENNPAHGKKWFTDGQKSILCNPDEAPNGFRSGHSHGSSSFKGKKHSEKSKVKMRKARKGKAPWNKGKRYSNIDRSGFWITDGTTNKLCSDNIIPDGFTKGFTSKSTSGKFWANDGIKNIMLNNGEELPIGFTKGMLRK